MNTGYFTGRALAAFEGPLEQIGKMLHPAVNATDTRTPTFTPTFAAEDDGTGSLGSASGDGPTHFPATSFWKRGLLRSGSKLERFAPPGSSAAGSLLQALDEVQAREEAGVTVRIGVTVRQNPDDVRLGDAGCVGRSQVLPRLSPPRRDVQPVDVRR